MEGCDVGERGTRLLEGRAKLIYSGERARQQRTRATAGTMERVDQRNSGKWAGEGGGCGQKAQDCKQGVSLGNITEHIITTCIRSICSSCTFLPTIPPSHPTGPVRMWKTVSLICSGKVRRRRGRWRELTLAEAIKKSKDIKGDPPPPVNLAEDAPVLKALRRRSKAE